MVLLTAGAAMLVPAIAGATKLAAAGVMSLAALRFAVTGISEMTGSSSWSTLAGLVGLVLAAAASSSALGFELEDARHRTVLPLLRRGPGREAMEGEVADQLTGVAREAGVRQQL